MNRNIRVFFRLDLETNTGDSVVLLGFWSFFWFCRHSVNARVIILGFGTCLQYLTPCFYFDLLSEHVSVHS